MKPRSLLRFLCLILLVVSACIPASPPANLSATAGSAAIITNDTYSNTVFSLIYPTGWRVITSPAGAPPSVTLVAPGNCALIVVSSAAIDNSPASPSCTEPKMQSSREAVMLGRQQVELAGTAPSADWNAFADTLNQIAGSLKAVSS